MRHNGAGGGDAAGAGFLGSRHAGGSLVPQPAGLFAVTSAAFIVRAVAADCETTWFEGLMLVGAYLMLGLAYFFVDPA